MRTIWLNLAWKEWHEHKWKLAALVATLCGVMALMLLSIDRRGSSEGPLLALRVVLVMCIVPLAIFIGLGTAAGERSRGTLSFMQALPVPMWRVALNKVFFGLVTIAGAALLTLLFVYVWCKIHALAGTPYHTAEQPDSSVPFSFGIRNWFGNSALAILCVAFSFYIWTIACGVNSKDEVSAGAVALLAMVLWTVLISYAVHWLFDPPRPGFITGVFPQRLAVIAVSTTPGGALTLERWVSSNHIRDVLGLGIFAAIVSHLGLAAWYVLRFGRITNREVRSPQVAIQSANQIDWLGSPRSSAFMSVAWKQFRESMPIVLAGLAGIIGITAATQLTEWAEFDNPTFHVGEIYNGIAVVLGFVMAMVIGVGVCFYDVQPPLNAFWRSRPINADLWFCCKFITGLVVLLAAIYVPMFLIWAMGDSTGVNKLDFTGAYTLPIAHVAVFASAVAMTCLIRNAIYAAILSVVFMYLGVLLAFATWYVAAFVGWASPNSRIWIEPTLMQGTTGLITSLVISTLIAWLAMRNDWGKTNRY